MRLSASLVLYNNPAEQFGEAMRCYLEGSAGELFVIDNSPEPLSHPLFDDPRVHYVFADENLGFGKGHNRALKLVGDSSDAHLFLNPDVSFTPEVLPHLLRHLGEDATAGAVMPRIEYMNGSLQRLCKLLPTPMDLFLRRFIPIPMIQRRINRRYELHELSQDAPIVVPSLSGCFLVARTQVLQNIGGFDERYFMYMEDVDLVRRIGDEWETVYVPAVRVLHGYEKASYKNPVLKKAHIRSARLYFSKWGWVLDSERARRNRRVLAAIRAVAAGK